MLAVFHIVSIGKTSLRLTMTDGQGYTRLEHKDGTFACTHAYDRGVWVKAADAKQVARLERAYQRAVFRQDA